MSPPFGWREMGFYRGEELAPPLWIQKFSNLLWVKPHMAIACWRGWHWRLADLFDRAWESAGLLASRVWVFWVSVERGRREWAWRRREGWGKEHGERREGRSREVAGVFFFSLKNAWFLGNYLGFCFWELRERKKKGKGSSGSGRVAGQRVGYLSLVLGWMRNGVGLGCCLKAMKWAVKSLGLEIN